MKIDDTPLDFLTVKIWIDKPMPHFIGPYQTIYVCQVGENLVEGSAGFALTPLEALKRMAEAIGRDEGIKSDNGKFLFR